MSKIEEQIKVLLKKKKKVEFLQHILSSVTDYDQADFQEVKSEVVALMTSFISKTIAGIEDSAPPQAPVQVPAQAAGTTPSMSEDSVPKAKTPDAAEISAQEKVSFALANRELSGRTVTAYNTNGDSVSGKVVGLDYPNILVQPENGPILKIPRNQIQL